MIPSAVREAADILWRAWRDGVKIDALPPRCRPADRRQAYAVQAAVAEASGQALFGWKIAATSAAGQKHIGVDGPLAGRLLRDRVFDCGATVPLDHNGMRVAEAEFAFQIGKPLPARGRPYSVDEVLDAVDSLHPALEIPDSRYRDFVQAGAPQLVADNACACWFVLGTATGARWRDRDLAAHAVRAYRNGRFDRDGTGANVLGDPRVALAWLTNELTAYSEGLLPGQVVTTGTCVTPLEISPGEHVRADFGDFGEVEARFA